MNLVCKIFLSLLLVIGMTGCGTVATHLMPASQRPPGVGGVYRGTKFDSFVLSGIGKSKEAEVWGYGVVFGPIVVCDFPFSIVADTLMLPFDAFSNNSTNAP
ncbi:MAG: YceK/YidQ family lipoprotein [Verrucomicrobia bacterium]|nr:YceK/YidQ family lipoprotein [Verrucomicrobiota bacterium]